MKKFTRINENISVTEDIRKDRTIISIIDGDKEIILSDLKTDDFFSNKWVCDENYIVSYSKGCMVNQYPLIIEAAYSIKNKRLLNVNNEKIKELLEYMLICKKGFDLTKILTEINNSDLGLLSNLEKDELKNYLTSGNINISRDDIIHYILEEYPQLKKYKNLNKKLSVLEYRSIEEELNRSIFWLHIIPQDLSFVEEEQEKLLKK